MRTLPVCSGHPAGVLFARMQPAIAVEENEESNGYHKAAHRSSQEREQFHDGHGLNPFKKYLAIKCRAAPTAKTTMASPLR